MHIVLVQGCEALWYHKRYHVIIRYYVLSFQVNDCSAIFRFVEHFARFVELLKCRNESIVVGCIKTNKQPE